MRLVAYPILLVWSLLFCVPGVSQTMPPDKNAIDKVWLDPALKSNGSIQRIVIWFDKQFLPTAESFETRRAEFDGRTRSEMRKQVVATLKSISDQSFGAVKGQLGELEAAKHVRQLRQHWIVNGFSCVADEKGIEAIRALDGVAKIFRKRAIGRSSKQEVGPAFLKKIPESTFAIDLVEGTPWNIDKIRAPEVWEKYGITGSGTLNVVHDFGFKLNVQPLAETIYSNSGEIPGNKIDDDNNGFVDDYHGFDFDQGTANLGPVRIRGTIIHGNACAAMISGTFATGTHQAIGIAPGSKWAPVIGTSNIEQAIEWAIDQGADTYSMSFSQPNLLEFRSHWRKVMEQGTLCGVVFISGAGNFAAGKGSAPIPVQMRNPEDIPMAVLGVAGVGQDGKRPSFSSQGPVRWKTEYYQDGKTNKPDFATINFRVPCIDLEGKLSNQASGNSFAGPHMAGIVSLMFSADPELLPWEVRDILLKTAEDIGDPGYDFQMGHGFVNAFDAVTEVIARRE